jgi:hypothetical protein|tara:strand:+ start:1508 stop:1834 length:327 start_codon:yes stop_codon:yes gene_type:complete
MEFISSNGTLLVNKNGTVHKDSDLDGWLLDIAKVDLEELDNYYKIQTLNECEGGDVLDFGWWDKKGNYNKPEKVWRIETFHKPELNEKEVEKIVNISFQWIDDNRSCI